MVWTAGEYPGRVIGIDGGVKMRGYVITCRKSNIGGPVYMTKESDGFRIGETTFVENASIVSHDEFLRLKENRRIPKKSDFVGIMQ